ncbi:hypothetical protein KKG22_04860 [Patescibacteria group bacterium]|nr:hypothetical protein [Patescibacteria group bacterium]MBU1721666.1 hypothetical protein [Patescibacteria group bacterium]MBU1900975.1 hypothetical protein [Patescibacteria group bacterium]
MIQPTVLTIVDGWGIDVKEQAPRFDTKKHIANYIQEYPAGILHASGVGLGVSALREGNVALGYTSIGTGVSPINYMIDYVIHNESFWSLPAVDHLFREIKESKNTVHMIVSLSLETEALLRRIRCFMQTREIKEITTAIVVHIVIASDELLTMDRFLLTLAAIQDMDGIQIGTVVGSRYGCDASNHWERTQRAYDGIFNRDAEETRSAKLLDFVRLLLEKEYTLETLPPVMTQDSPAYHSGDIVLFFDTKRAHTAQLVKLCFVPSSVHTQVDDQMFRSGYTLVSYAQGIPAKVLWSGPLHTDTLLDVLREHNIAQAYISDGKGYPLLLGRLHTSEGVLQTEYEHHMIDMPEIGLDPLVRLRKHVDMLMKKVIMQSELVDGVLMVSMQYLDDCIATHDQHVIDDAYTILDEYIHRVSEHVLSLGGLHMIVGSFNAHDLSETVPVLCIAEVFRGQALRYGDVPEGNMRLAPPSGSLLDIAPSLLFYKKLDKPQHMVGHSLF